MNNTTATTTLQVYAPAISTVLTDAAISAFLLGILTVLSMVSTAHLIRRGVKQSSAVFMLGSTAVLHASTAVYFAAHFAYFVGYGQLLNEAVSAISSEASGSPTHISVTLMQFGHDARTKSHIIAVVLAITVSLGDTIVWWRVCVLWRNKVVLALGIVLIASTFGFGIVSSVHWQITTDTPPLLSYDDVYEEISTFLSFATNVLATSLIAQKAWKHRRVLCQSPGVSKSRLNTPVMRVLTLLVESGIVYSIILGLVVLDIAVSRSKVVRSATGAKFISGLSLSLSACFVPILALYPTIIISIVAHNYSPIDGSLSNASPSGMSTALLPTLVFGDGISSQADGSAEAYALEERSINTSS